MTGVFYATAHWLLSLLPVDQTGRRVFDKTLADWRKEAGSADSIFRKLTVVLLGVGAVVRSVLMVSTREVTSREGSSALLRLAAWSIACLLLTMALNWNQSIPVNGTTVPVGPVVTALGSMAWVVTLLPLLAFASMASGHRTPVPEPRLGPALVMSVVMVGLMGWGIPAAFQTYRELMFSLSSGLSATMAGAPAPGMNERSVVELISLLSSGRPGVTAALNLRLFFVIAVPVTLVLGATARSIAGKRRLVASLYPLVTFGIPFLGRIDSGLVPLSLWGGLFGAILVVSAMAMTPNGEGRQVLLTAGS